MGEISAKRKEKSEREEIELLESKLCPYLLQGKCDMKPCPFIHGLQCETCGLYVLIEGHAKQNEKHRKECSALFEADMEDAFKVSEEERIRQERLSRSRGKLCGICMEEVISLEPASERRFAIFEKCKHVFCLKCIRNWRSNNAYEKDLVRSCPICRTLSHFIVPSYQYWIESDDEKAELIESYKQNLSNKDCRHFNFGNGECPFSVSCFYRHQYKDGTLQDRSKIDPRQTKRHQWDSGIFAELLATLEGDEEMDLVNMFTRLAHIEPRRDWSTEASTEEFNGATNDNNETWTTTSNWTRSGSGMVSFTGDDLDAAMLRDEILDEIGFEFNQGGYYQNDISDNSTDDDYDLYDEMP